jgi:hypothetical protein
LIAFDNVSALPAWLSDALCRLATGGGFATRELYADADEIIFNVQRPVILNGIDYLPERADLADRCLILNLPRIEDTSRKPEKDLYAEFDQALPGILGALLSSVSAALRGLTGIKLPRLPRMADFAEWAVAAEVALGFEPGSFLASYDANRSEITESTLEADPVAVAIRTFGEKLPESDPPWKGICKDLLEKLETFTSESTRKSPAWPKTPRALSGRLRRMATYLRQVGINVDFPAPGTKGTGGARHFSLSRTPMHSTASTATTATGDPNPQINQRPDLNVSGGCASEVANGRPVANEPPLDQPCAKCLPLINGSAIQGGSGGSGGSLPTDSNAAAGVEEGWI